MKENPLPRLFIGSSSDKRSSGGLSGRDVARAIQHELKQDALVRVWDQGVFVPGETFIEALAQLDNYDFGVFVLTRDDVTISRGRRSSSPRDNVLFELGLFIGKLGRERCYYLCEEGAEIKLPTDLLGVSGETFTMPAERSDLRPSVGAACDTFRNLIHERGFRPRLPADAVSHHAKIAAFWARIAGTWFQRIDGEQGAAYCLLDVASDHGPQALAGRAFDANGVFLGSWHSAATCVRLDGVKPRVFYQWQGGHKTKKETTGGGEITFEANEGAALTRADGVYLTVAVGPPHTGFKKYFSMHRCAPKDAEKLRAGEIPAALLKRLAK